jgi:hypothetical protein
MEYVAILATIFGLALTMLNIWDKVYTNKQRVRQEGASQQATTSDMEVLRQGNATIIVQLDKMDTKMDNMHERLIRVEESTKSAHHRIDGLEGRHD